MTSLEASYKAREVEGIADLHFFRPFGYRIALICRVIGLTPNAVTALGVLVSLFGAHLLYYPSLNTNILGIAFLVLGEILDHADGQLARITNQFSAWGRIFDGLGDNIKFVGIYLHLLLRLLDSSQSSWPIVLTFCAALSHSLQSGLADYYCNGYLRFGIAGRRAEFDSSTDIRKRWDEVPWRNPIEKLLLSFYLSYTRTQERLGRALHDLHLETIRVFKESIPPNFRSTYAQMHQRWLRWSRVLTTNARLMALSGAILLGRPILYLVFEVIVLNAVFVVAVVGHSRADRLMIGQLRSNISGMKSLMDVGITGTAPPPSRRARTTRAPSPPG
jgi:hypothetical protein